MNKRVSAVKDFFKYRTPSLFSAAKALQIQVSELLPARYVFGNIYRTRGWDDLESLSGPGSSLSQTEAVRAELPLLIEQLQVHSLLDAPCGDFRWMSETELSVESYLGVDVVRELIEQNVKRYPREGRDFAVLDITKDPLPYSDLILCRDCLFHFSVRAIFAALRNFAATGSKYLLTTTYPELHENIDIPVGGWRPLNLELPPFGFPRPLRLINEHFLDSHGRLNTEKGLALWKVEDLPLGHTKQERL